MKKLALALTLACLLGLASARAQNAYITNQSSNTVSVIDTTTDTVIATIPVGQTPFGVAVSPDGRQVYVTNVFSNTVSVIDTATSTVSATIPVGLPPPNPFCNPTCADMAVAVSPDSSKIYVNKTFSNSSTVSVIGAATNTVSATIPVGPALGVAVAPDGSKVYVAGAGISVIDTATNTVSATIPVFAFGVAVTPDGSKLYVTHTEGFPSPVEVIDTATNTVIAMTGDHTQGGSYGVAVTPDGRKVYVANGFGNTLSVIDTATDAVIATIPDILLRTGEIGFTAYGVAVKPDGSKVYVSNLASNTVSVIDTATNTVSAMIPVGSQPVAFGAFIQSARRSARASHDFNGDGKSDIAWRDTSGNVAIWEMNGTTILNPNTAGVGNVPTTWSIVGTGDFGLAFSRAGLRCLSISRSTNPACSSTFRCLDTAGWLISNGAAISFTDASPAASRDRIARRVGSASAAKTASRFEG
jgi:YVTN family beta-propeller protein